MRLILTLFLLLTAVGLWEMFRHRWHRRRIPVRVHINGSRGKSSVTRLIAAGLRAGGYRVFAKTTGSAARIILPDESEYPIQRRGGPNIREQLGIFRQAVAAGADALVLECMAVRPDLQWTTEHRIVKATHGVITNVRPDHLEAMGPRLSDVAISLSGTIPKRSKFFTAEYRFLDLMEGKSLDNRTRFHLARAEEVAAEDLEGFAYVELADNLSLALKVCASLDIPRDVALESMRKVKPDPGALIPVRIQEDGRQVEFINLFAANDPESTAFLWKHLALGNRGDRTLALINIRADRMRRSKDLAPLFGRQLKAYRYVLVGEMTHVFTDMIRRQGVPAEEIIDLGGKSAEQIWTRIVAESVGNTTVVGLANIGGAGVTLMELIEGKERAA
jgi:gamma-polyglutamate synthase